MLEAKNVPNELKKLDNWVLWKDTNNTKIPFNVKTLRGAKSNDNTTWTSFIDAYTTLINEPSFTGLGFMLSDNIICIDLDNKNDEMPEDEFKALLHEILDTIPSYCEISVSGKGYHIFAKGKLPDGYRKKKHIEMYDTNRFIAFTGNVYGGVREVIEAQEGIDKIHAKYLGSKTEVVSAEVISQDSGLSVDEIFERAKNNDRFNTLYQGDWESLGFPSQSEADASFSSMLAFYTNRDIKLMDTIFRSSGLYRNKYNRRQGKSTYGKLLLENAMSWITETWQEDFVNVELISYKMEETEPKPIEVIRTSPSGERAVKEAKTVEIAQAITPSRYTDTANAGNMIEIYGKDIKYNFDNKAWYIWDGMVWEWDTKDRIKQLAEQVGNQMLNHAKKLMDDVAIKNALRLLNVAGKKNMIEEAKHQDGIAILNEECDNQQFMINTASGIYDLEADKLLPHNREYNFTKIIPHEISKKVPKLWLKFLHEVFMGDVELMKYVQKLVGYTLTGSIKEQAIFILYGGGNNGKSIFIDTLQAVMGDYATTVPIEVLMERKGGVNIETTLARIKGARLIHASESESDDQINEGLIKQITGGEKVIGRFLYGNQFEYYPEYKLWLSTNNKPMIKGTDYGIWRRIIVIPFNYSIPEEKVDKDLMIKMRAELPEILNWAIEGYRLYEKEGLDVPQIILDEKDKYKSEMDIMANFINDRIDKKAGYQVQANIVYKEYEKWCKKNNVRVLSMISFGKEFGKHFDKKRVSSGYMYLDCTLRAEEQSYVVKEFRGGK